MTIEEKLKHFYDTSVDEARRQAEKRCPGTQGSPGCRTGGT